MTLLASIWHNTACPHDCPDGCALRARFDGKTIEMEPNRALPWSTFICPKGLRWRERTMNPSRLLNPLFRKGSQWLGLSWEQAWELWAERIADSLERHGPLSLMFYQSAGSLFFSKLLLPHLFSALGGMTSLKGNLCSSAGSHGLKEAFGEVPVQLPETVAEHARGVLLWGRNVWDCHPHFVPILQAIQQRGAQIASVEIRSTATSRNSDHSWTIRPGTDAFLAAWLCRKLLGKGVVSKGWKERTANAKHFQSFLLSLTSEELLAPTGLSEGKALALLDWIITHIPVTHCPGFGIQRYLCGDLAFQWIGILAVMLGAFDQPGGGLVFSKDEMARFPSSLLPTGGLSRRLPVATWHRKFAKLDPPVNVLTVSGANPLRQGPDNIGQAEVMRHIPFKVCIDLFMTETAAASDLVLPVASFLEEGADWRGSYWHNYLLRTERVLPPRGKSLPETTIFTGLARQLGLSLDLESLKGSMDRELLRDRALEKISPNLYRWDEPDFWQNPSSRCTAPLRLPPLTHPGDDRIRVISVHSKGYINGQSDDAPESEKADWAALHPTDATERDLCQDMPVILTNGNGAELVRTLRLDPDLARGCCLIQQGMPGVNSLSPALAGPGYGAPFHETRVRIRPLKDEK